MDSDRTRPARDHRTHQDRTPGTDSEGPRPRDSDEPGTSGPTGHTVGHLFDPGQDRHAGAPVHAVPGLLTTKQAAEYLNVSERWIIRATQDHRLPVVKMGRLNRYQRDDLDDFIAANTRAAV